MKENQVLYNYSYERSDILSYSFWNPFFVDSNPSYISQKKFKDYLFNRKKGAGLILETYEVIRFMEHGTHCRPTMDCVKGRLLIYRVKEQPEVRKEVVFRWFRELLLQIEQYQKCHNGQCYRYINPYSVLITEEEQVLLLDLEAKSNAFVMKQMQTRAMRTHFVKPIVHMRESSNLALDLYSYAKTMQFILAGTSFVPSLKRSEEIRLAAIIDKCLEETPKKQFENLQQVQRRLPVVAVKKETKEGRRYGKRVMVLGILFVALLVGYFQVKSKEVEPKVQAKEAVEESKTQAKEVVKESKAQAEEAVEELKSQTEEAVEQERTSQDQLQVEDGLDEMEKEITVIEQYVLRNTSKDNEAVMEQGEVIHRNVLRYLAAAYDREEKQEEALRSYKMLCQIEEEPEFAKTAYLRCMELETTLYEGGLEAVWMGQEGLRTFPDSQEIAEAYLEAICGCKEMEEAEKRTELHTLIKRFPELEKTESYVQWKEEQPVEK